MRKILISALLSIVIIFVSNSIDKINDSQVIKEFKDITDIDINNKELLNTDFEKIDYKQYFYFYCLVSEDLQAIVDCNDWLKNIENEIANNFLNQFKNTNVQNWDSEKQKDFAEKLLIFLHEQIFKKYDVSANTVLSVASGSFNCVSSSIIYAMLLKKFGLNCVGVETIDHVLIKIIFDNQTIDVETTNKYGFNPGKKNEVLDEFGKVTGFTYVPQKDYKNRNDIDLKKMLFLVYHNLSDSYFKNKDYKKSANLCYLIYKGRNDIKGKDDFEKSFNNYIVALVQDKKYYLAIGLLNQYLENIAWNENFSNMRLGIIYSYINDWTEYDGINDFGEYLLKQNDKFSKIKNDIRFIDDYFYYTYKSTEYFNKNNKFNDSYILINNFNHIFNHKEISKVFANTLNMEINLYEKQNDYDLIKKRISEIKLEFPEYIDIIKKSEKIYLLNEVNFLLQNSKYTDALSLAKQLQTIYTNDDDAKTVLLNAYVKYTISLYDKKDINNLIKYCEEGLKEFPNDRILKNNYLSFYKNIITEKIQKKDYSEARRILNIALDKFYDDSYLLNLDKVLKELRY